MGLGERGGAVLKAVLCRPCFAIRETADLRIDMRTAGIFRLLPKWQSEPDLRTIRTAPQPLTTLYCAAHHPGGLNVLTSRLCPRFFLPYRCSTLPASFLSF